MISLLSTPIIIISYNLAYLSKKGGKKLYLKYMLNVIWGVDKISSFFGRKSFTSPYK